MLLEADYMKRTLDLIISLGLMIFVLPIMLIVALLIYIKIGYPCIFRQKRPGLQGKPFYIYKFRTMTNAVDEVGNLLPDKNRITELGRILRKFSLDELPQLLNVIQGELSLVGPRPLLMEYLPIYSSEQVRRHDVKPGITGWAQVNGRNSISWEEKFELDVWYVDHQSFWLDIKILCMTLLKVVKSEGISQQGQVTMEAFNECKIKR